MRGYWERRRMFIYANQRCELPASAPIDQSLPLTTLWIWGLALFFYYPCGSTLRKYLCFRVLGVRQIFTRSIIILTLWWYNSASDLPLFQDFFPCLYQRLYNLGMRHWRGGQNSGRQWSDLTGDSWCLFFSCSGSHFSQVSDARRTLTPDQTARDSEGILTVWDYLDVFQPVSLDISAPLLRPLLRLLLISGQQERAKQMGRKLYRFLNRLQSLVLS